jgi:glycosyltransferase involved in cell wall biosynthesis
LIESYDWGGPLSHKPEIPFVVRLQGSLTAYSKLLNTPITKLLCETELNQILFADKYIAVCNSIKELSLSSFNLDNNNIDIVFNCIDTKTFSPQKIKRSENELLFVGTITYRKGVYNLIKAFNIVAKRFNKVRLRLIGDIRDHDDLNSAMDKLSPDTRKRIIVQKHIQRDLLPEYYSKATIVIVPSFADAFPLVLLEAMACEAPVIVTDMPFAREVVLSNKIGILTDCTDHFVLANSISELLLDSTLQRLIGCNARKIICERYDISYAAQRSVDIYKELLS